MSHAYTTNKEGLLCTLIRTQGQTQWMATGISHLLWDHVEISMYIWVYIKLLCH